MTAVGCRFLTFVVIVAFIAGCTSSNGSPSPSPTPPVTSSSSTSPSPEPTQSEPLTTGPNVRPGEKPPEFPAEAKQHTADGALAFAGYFYRAYDWGYATNDAFSVAEISDPACSACRRYVRGLDAVRRKPGAVLLGGRIQLNSASIFQGVLDLPAEYAVDVGFNEQTIVLKQPGAPDKTLAPAVRGFHSLVFVDWRHGHWDVVEVTDKK